jgi:hypothetical protein
MLKLLVGMTLIFIFITRSALAASLTLGCSGTLTTVHLPKNGMASEPEKENIVDKSLVINLDQRTVSGFWWDRDPSGNYIHNPIPIISIDPNGVDFRARKGDKIQDSTIEGTVDRITGKVDATEERFWKVGGSIDKFDWDLRCKPSKPLF